MVPRLKRPKTAALEAHVEMVPKEALIALDYVPRIISSRGSNADRSWAKRPR